MLDPVAPQPAWRFASALIAAAAACSASCAPGEGALFVTVSSSGVVVNVDHLRVLVAVQGASATPLTVPVPMAPTSIPPIAKIKLDGSGTTEN